MSGTGNGGSAFKQHVGEIIALIVTVVLGAVFVDFAAIMTYAQVTGKPVDREISVHFGALMLAFVAVWRTNFGGGDTNVNTGPTGTATVNTTQPTPAVEGEAGG